MVISYHANRVSCASCCTFLYTLSCIVLPYVVVYTLGGLWTKETPAREQPLVRSRYEVLVEAYASNAVTGTPVVPLLWSTSAQLNDALGVSLRPMQLRSWYEDDERNGRPERMQFVLNIPVDADAGERLHSVSVVLGVDVAFDKEFRLRLNGSLHLQAASPLPGRAWVQSADLTLRSDQPQRSRDRSAREPCPEPTWAFARPVLPSGAPASAASILEQYTACNDTVALVAQPPLWTPGVSSDFEARLTVHVPAILAARRPGFVETYKLAAVQYIAFFIPCRAILRALHGALFRLGVVTARVHHPIKQHVW